MAYATPEDIENRLGRDLDASETTVVTTRLEDAEMLLKSRIPDLDQKITDGIIQEQAVVMVESDMILRLIRNPDGFKSETDGSYTYRINEDVASGRLQILPEEWNLLGIRAGVFTIKPYVQVPEYGTVDNYWEIKS